MVPFMSDLAEEWWYRPERNSAVRKQFRAIEPIKELRVCSRCSVCSSESLAGNDHGAAELHLSISTANILLATLLRQPITAEVVMLL